MHLEYALLAIVLSVPVGLAVGVTLAWNNVQPLWKRFILQLGISTVTTWLICVVMVLAWQALHRS